MRWMFGYSSITTIDLSSFDMSGNKETSNMFIESVATTGYARTDADADILNATTNKPAGLVFVKKPTT